MPVYPRPLIYLLLLLDEEFNPIMDLTGLSAIRFHDKLKKTFVTR